MITALLSYISLFIFSSWEPVPITVKGIRRFPGFETNQNSARVSSTSCAVKATVMITSVVTGNSPLVGVNMNVPISERRQGIRRGIEIERERGREMKREGESMVDREREREYLCVSYMKPRVGEHRRIGPRRNMSN